MAKVLMLMVILFIIFVLAVVFNEELRTWMIADVVPLLSCLTCLP